ncbi:unnamed protein product [Rotaria sordida]|uniref:SLC12A transporter C-terminal domain-containing protein n=1 Tax=Rotaria sordida TaxID=392033 RepID=A0A815QL51_9BILA|nr:unnamed protein product [Rotaria sordida]CAF1643158.1 unnamed protein product [Rotaria sordida]
MRSILVRLVGASKIFQAVCRDMIYSRLKYFAVNNGKSNKPIRTYVLIYFVAVSFTAIDKENSLNISCFSNKFSYLLKIFVEINWGSSVQARAYRRAQDATHKLDNIQRHVKNFRPQILVLTGNPIYRPTLVDLCSLVTYGHSLMIMWKCDFSKTWLKNHTVKVFYQTVVALTVRQGVISLFQCVDKLRPNVVVLGFKNDWLIKAEAAIDYFNIIHDALHLKYGIGILRLKTGLDFNSADDDNDDDDVDDDEESTIFNSLRVSISQNNNNINNT